MTNRPDRESIGWRPAGDSSRMASRRWPSAKPDASQTQMVTVGRLTAAVGLIIAMFIAPQLGNLGQAFQFIQEYTGVVSPGILAVFLAGLFWKPATNRAAILGVLVSIPIAMYFKVGPNGWIDSPLFVTLPFMNQMMWTCIITFLLIVGVSHLQTKGQPDPKNIQIDQDTFATPQVFNISAFGIMLVCTMLYAVFW
jgi:SSS family solute:Na+ symporter